MRLFLVHFLFQFDSKKINFLSQKAIHLKSFRLISKLRTHPLLDKAVAWNAIAAEPQILTMKGKPVPKIIFFSGQVVFKGNVPF